MQTLPNSAQVNLDFIMASAQAHCHFKFVELLTNLSAPTTAGSDLLAGLVDAPAGKRYHHSERHGLIAHLADMLRMWSVMSNTEGHTFNKLRENLPHADHYMTTGILVHDLHKASQFYTMTAKQVDSETVFEEVEHTYLFDYYKPKGVNLDNDQRTLSLLLMGNVPIDELLLQMVFNAEGGYAKHRANSVHVLSKALYLLDEMSVMNWRIANNKLVSQP